MFDLKIKLYDDPTDKTYNKSFKSIPDTATDSQVTTFAAAYDVLTTDSILDPIYKVTTTEVPYE